MQQNDFAIRRYFGPALYKSARIIGYSGISPFDFWDKAKALTVRIKGDNSEEKQVPFVGAPDAACTETQVKDAIEELTKLLGPASEHPFREFLFHGPPDIMGEENATRW